MAGGAGIELDPGILCSEVRTCGEMTFVAGDLSVHPGEGIFRFRMVEMLYLFPIVEIVAALAIRSEFAFVGIRVAAYAVESALVRPHLCAREYGISRKQCRRVYLPADTPSACGRIA